MKFLFLKNENRKSPLTFLRPQRRRRRIVYDFEKYYLYNLCKTVWDTLIQTPILCILCIIPTTNNLLQPPLKLRKKKINPQDQNQRQLDLLIYSRTSLPFPCSRTPSFRFSDPQWQNNCERDVARDEVLRSVTFRTKR